MDLLHKIVFNSALGEGEVCECQFPFFKVKYGDVIKPYMFPVSFNGSICFVDPEVQASINELLDIEQKGKMEKLRNSTYVSQSQSLSRKSNSIPYHKNSDRTNIAFKCNFCNGGNSENRIGFNGVCSDDVIDYNIRMAKHPWCCSYDSMCRRYFDNEIDRDDLEDSYLENGSVCYESKMFRDWIAQAGYNLDGDEKNKPKKIRNVQSNGLAVLTSRFPNDSEMERFIFGVFLIDEVYEGDQWEEGYVTAHEKYRIELTPREARKIKFWNYYQNGNSPGKCHWGTGLFRYVYDLQSAQILRDIATIQKDRKQKNVATEFFHYYCKIKNISEVDIPKPNGALIL